MLNPTSVEPIKFKPFIDASAVLLTKSSLWKFLYPADSIKGAEHQWVFYPEHIPKLTFSTYVTSKSAEPVLITTRKARPIHSKLYKSMRALSTLAALGFLALFISSLVQVGPVHWAVYAVGSLVSIGLAGAVWLSQLYWKRRNIF